MSDEELEKRADVIACFEADQWPVAKRDVIRQLVRSVWLQAYKRGRSECLTTKNNENDSKGTD